nr:hypothetical protein [Photobacterium leiognathi]
MFLSHHQLLPLDKVSYDKNKKIVTVVATNKAGWTKPDVLIDGHSKRLKR